MFVGHYGVSYFLKGLDRRVSLGLLFIAVQFVDILWAVLVLLGVEKGRVVPDITAATPVDFYFMPYTHSLVATLVWAFLAYFFYKSSPRRPGGAAALVGLAVFSHWVLDFLVHRPDLPLVDDVMKVGLGLWDYPVLSLGLEAGILGFGVVYYAKKTLARSWLAHYSVWIFAVLMLMVQSAVLFGPPPSSVHTVAAMGLVSYALLAGAAHWLEKGRS